MVHVEIHRRDGRKRQMFLRDSNNQAAAWKLVMDRILPVAAFEKDVVQNSGKSAIQINITGVGNTEVKEFDASTIQPTVIDGDNGEIL